MPVSTTGRVVTHSINIKTGPSIDYTDRVKAISETLQTEKCLTEDLNPREGRAVDNSTTIQLNRVCTIHWLHGSSYSTDICQYEAELRRSFLVGMCDGISVTRIEMWK